MIHFQRKAPVHFKIIAATVNPQAKEYNPLPLIGYLKELGIEYHMLTEDLIDRAKSCMENNSLCSFCSRMKRGMLYTCARKNSMPIFRVQQNSNWASSR